MQLLKIKEKGNTVYHTAKLWRNVTITIIHKLNIDQTKKSDTGRWVKDVCVLTGNERWNFHPSHRISQLKKNNLFKIEFI